MSFDINYDIPTIITKRNVDSMENPIGVKLLEKKQVMDNHSCIVLSQIPDENYRITIEGFNEVFNSDELGNNNFYVSYSQGVIYFLPRYNGKTVVVEYYGIGYELISASRVFYKYDKHGGIIETLEEILDNAKEQLELIKTLGDSVKVIEKLEMDLENGKVLHDNLENDIEVGTPLQENLHSDIVEAKKWKDQLHQDVTDGKVLQPLLQQTVDDAEDVKVRLDKSIADAQEDIATIEATGNKEILIQSSQWRLNGDVYEKEISHPCNSENLHVTAKNSDTKEAVTIGYKILDKTRILLKSDEAINMSVILSASYYHATQTISDNIAEEVVKSRKGKTSLDVKITEIDEQLDTIAPNPSYESIYDLATIKDLTIVGYGDSTMVGVGLPECNGLDGEQQGKGLKNYLNRFYIDLLKKTGNFLRPITENVILKGNWIYKQEESYLFPVSELLQLVYNYNDNSSNLKFEYYGKNITIWGIKSTNSLAKACCDVYIDGTLVGEIDQGNTNTDDWFYGYTFNTEQEKEHTVELKNFKNKYGATSGTLAFNFFGVTNRHHKVLNEAHGGKGTTWGIENLEDRVISKKPDILFLAFGNNDGYGYGIPNFTEGNSVEDFRKNLNYIIDKIQYKLPNCIISLNNIIPASDVISHEIKDYVKVIEGICRKRNCRLIDTFNLLSNISPSEWRADNVHLNTKGNEIVLKNELTPKWSPQLLKEVKVEEKNDNITIRLTHKSLSDKSIKGACVFIDTDGKISTAVSDSKRVIGTLDKDTIANQETAHDIVLLGESYALLENNVTCKTGDLIVPSINGWCIVDNSATSNVLGIALESKDDTSNFKVIKYLVQRR